MAIARTPERVRAWRRARFAPSVYSVDEAGNQTWARHPDQRMHGRSTVKLLTAAAARGILTDLDASHRVLADCVVGEPKTIRPGDTITVSDLFHASIIESDALATGCLTRAAGTILLGGTATREEAQSRFITEMHAFATRIGWTGHTVTDPLGFGWTNAFTARDLVTLLRWVQHNDPWLNEIAGKLTHILVPTGNPLCGAYLPIEHTLITGGGQQLASVFHGAVTSAR